MSIMRMGVKSEDEKFIYNEKGHVIGVVDRMGKVKRRWVEGYLVAEDIEMTDIEEDDVVIKGEEYSEVIEEEFMILLGNWIQTLPSWLRPIIRFYYNRYCDKLYKGR